LLNRVASWRWREAESVFGVAIVIFIVLIRIEPIAAYTASDQAFLLGIERNPASWTFY